VGDGEGAVKAAPLITSTNAGELGPALDGRTDLTKYNQGARLSEGFIHLVQGPARRRGGTRFVEEVKDSSDRCWLVEFEFNETQAFTLELGDGYVRFFTQRGRLLVSGVAAYDNAAVYAAGDLVSQGGTNYYCIAATTGNAPPNATYWYALTGSIYEIPSPYTVADLTNSDGTCALRIEQSADVLYIAHAGGAIKARKLTRHANTNWQFTEYAPNDGPFQSLNDNPAITLYASGQSGSVTISAVGGNVFASTDVGRLVRLEVQDFSDLFPWEPDAAYAAGDLVRSDGKTYEAVNTDTSKTSAPIHDQGTAFDGKNGVEWDYQDPGYGIARITAYTSPTQVTATVLTDRDIGLNLMPFDVVGAGKATTRWQLGAWSATTGYPRSVTTFKNRLTWATRQGLHLSVPNDFDSMAEDFFNQVRDDCAINFTVNTQSNILWVSGGDKLIVGTGSGEYVGGEQNPNNPLAPGNFQCVRHSRRRCRGVPPVAVETSLLYVQRAGRKLLSMDYTIERDRYASSDQTVLNDRITRSGIIWTCYQGEPDSVLWCGLSNGKLVGFTLDQEQQVAGWGRHPIGGSGIVESGVASPSPDGTREDLWLLVRRTINGTTKRYIEYMERPWEGDDEDDTPGDDQEDAFYVDSGLTYDGAPATTITGLSHLEGAEVHVLADGAVVSPNPTVSGGEITLGRAASVVQIGLAFSTRWVSMRLEVATNDGTSQGKTKRPDGAAVRFVDTLGGKVGQYGGRLENISFRHISTPMGQPEPIRSETVDVRFEGEYNADCMIEIRQDQPLPMTITSIAPRMGVHGPR
jgi:hypothetical protein